jgi:hypothetical protein
LPFVFSAIHREIRKKKEFGTIQKRESKIGEHRNSKKSRKKIVLFSYKNGNLSDIVLS